MNAKQRNGKQLGAETVQRIRDLGEQGLGIRAIAKEVGVSPSTVHRYLFAKPDDPGAQPPSQAPEGATDGRGAKGRSTAGVQTTTNLEEAAIIAISPRRFELSSSLFWLAMEVTRREWNWPELSPQDWLDTYLYETMKQRGIILGSYMKVDRMGDGQAG